MIGSPSQADLAQALAAAAAAHHDYEQQFLNGVRDAQWSGFYAAYALGRLGDFAAPTVVARLLESAPGDGDWAAAAASHVIADLNGGSG